MIKRAEPMKTTADDWLSQSPSETNLTWKATSFALSTLHKIIRANIQLEGQENLSSRPTVYVLNHFTRFETFVVPYLIHRLTDRQPHSLAHHALFKGAFGEYLEKLGAISTDRPMKHRLIVGELMAGRDWMIFPEGAMMKNKDVFRRGQYYLNHPVKKRPPHTGAAVIALKAYYHRWHCRHGMERGDERVISYYRKRYRIPSVEHLSDEDLVIVPVNITYYPLRPGRNVLSRFASRIFKDLPAGVMEELIVEGQLLMSESDITIYFGKPIEVEQYVRPLLPLVQSMPFLSDPRRRSNMIVSMQKTRLTRRCMDDIYKKVKINVDHLFAAGLRHLKADRILRDDFYRVLYLSALEARTLSDRRLHRSLRKKLVTLVAEGRHPRVDDARQLALSDGLIEDDGTWLRLNRVAVEDAYTFDEIRLKNTLGVIANELAPLKHVNRVIRRYANMGHDELRREMVEQLFQLDQDRFETAYARYYREGESKPRSIGRPFFLRGSRGAPGIVLSHGYTAAPEEVRGLGEHLHARGYSVYGVCLEGHGTAPQHLSDVKWEDWVHSYYRGYTLIRNHCDDVVVGGFSTGGLLALLAAARVAGPVRGVFAINAPLKVQDIRSRFVGPAVMWNDLLQRFQKNNEEWEYVEHHPENPHINYGKNYLRGVLELQRLIGECRDALPGVNRPALILQSTQDPTVRPESGQGIHDMLSSERKTLAWIESDRHVIVQGNGRESIFGRIACFVDDVSGRSASVD